MPREIWLISDTHLNHSNILNFEDKEGNKIREFHDVHHMNEIIIGNWNKIIKPEDKVYHLGDVLFGPREDYERILSRLNGKKRLIVGNHDHIKEPMLHKYFEKIMMWRKWGNLGLLLTHVPVHESVLGETRFKDVQKELINVHGHIHQNKSPSERHINVCVEQTDYMPVNIEEVRKC